MDKGNDRENLARYILEDCVEDWYGLWEIYANVAERLGSSPSAAWAVEIEIDRELGSALQAELARLMEEGLLDASVWSYGAPKALTSGDIRDLGLDSTFWKSPGVTDADEQIRVAATDKGTELYRGRP